jgi:hypothetical protein
MLELESKGAHKNLSSPLPSGLLTIGVSPHRAARLVHFPLDACNASRLFEGRLFQSVEMIRIRLGLACRIDVSRHISGVSVGVRGLLCTPIDLVGLCLTPHVFGLFLFTLVPQVVWFEKPCKVKIGHTSNNNSPRDFSGRYDRMTASIKDSPDKLDFQKCHWHLFHSWNAIDFAMTHYDILTVCACTGETNVIF